MYGQLASMGAGARANDAITDREQVEDIAYRRRPR